MKLMMKRAIWGTALAAVFVLSMIMVPAFAGGHVNLQTVEVKNKGKQSVEFDVLGPLPQDGSLGAFGFGAIGTGAILAITTHGGVGPDSEAQAGGTGPVFHTHALQLKTVAAAICASETAIASASFKEVGDLEVTGVTVEVKNITGVGKLTGTVKSFTITLGGGELCVNFVKTVVSE